MDLKPHSPPNKQTLFKILDQSQGRIIYCSSFQKIRGAMSKNGQFSPERAV